MKTKPTLRSFLTLAASTLLVSPHAHAGNVWDGEAASSDNWQNTTNWSGNTFPNWAQPIIFAGNSRRTNQNQLTANNQSVGGINFTNDTTGRGFTITGKSIILNGDITTTAALPANALTDSWAIPMILNADRTITSNTDHNFTIQTAGIISETAGGPKALTKAGAATLTLISANTYSGDTTVTAGTLFIGNNLALQNSALATDGGGFVTLGSVNGTTPTFGGLTGSTDLAAVITGGYSTAINLTLKPLVNVTKSYSGTIADSAAAMTLTKTGLGTQILSGANTYSGDTAVNQGTLLFSTAGTGVSNVNVATGAIAGVVVAGTEEQHLNSGNLSLSNNSTLRIDYGGNATNTSVPPLAVGNFNPGTGITLQMDGSVAAGVPYPLVTWTTGPTDASAFNPILTSGLVGIYSIAGNTLRVTFSTPAPISWNTGDGIWDTTSSNWLKAGNPSTFANGLDEVIFGDASGIGVGVNPIITLATTVWSSGVTMNTTGRNYTISGSGTIAGPAGITLDSANTGTLTLATANTYTGNTQVTGGTLRLGDGGTGGSLAATSPITLAGGTTFAVNQGDAVSQGTDFGVISGNGGFAQTGAGTTTLNSLNTFTGPISVTQGTLQIGATGRLGGGTYAGGISIAAGAAIFQYGGTHTQTLSGIIGGLGSLVKASGSGILTLSGANTYEGGTTISGGTLRLAGPNAIASTSTISIAGGSILQPTIDGIAIDAPITLGATGTAQINGPFTAGPAGAVEILTLNQPISGDGNLRLFGSSEFNNTSGTIVLNAQNTYAGNTELDTAGTAVHLSGVNLFVKSGIVNALPATTVLTLDGDVGRGSGRTVQFDLNGFNQTLAGLTNVTTGTGLRIQRVINTGTSATLTINNSADFSFGSSADATTSTQPSAKISGRVNLTKSGAGTFTLVGIHAYAGNTTVTEGILVQSAANNHADPLPPGLPISNDASTYTIAPTATLNLNFVGTDNIGQLFIGNTQQPAGVYGSLGSGAQFESAQITGTGTLTVARGSAPGGYAGWAATNAGGQASGLDFDNDGVANGVEFFMNAAAGFTSNPQLSTGVPTTITWPNGGNIPASAYGTQFLVQTSPDLAVWTNVLIGDLTSNTASTLTYTLTGGSPRFVRLSVNPD